MAKITCLIAYWYKRAQGKLVKTDGDSINGDT